MLRDITSIDGCMHGAIKFRVYIYIRSHLPIFVSSINNQQGGNKICRKMFHSVPGEQFRESKKNHEEVDLELNPLNTGEGITLYIAIIVLLFIVAQTSYISSFSLSMVVILFRWVINYPIHASSKLYTYSGSRCCCLCASIFIAIYSFQLGMKTIVYSVYIQGHKIIYID